MLESRYSSCVPEMSMIPARLTRRYRSGNPMASRLPSSTPGMDPISSDIIMEMLTLPAASWATLEALTSIAA